MFSWNIRKNSRPFTYKEDVFVKTLMIGFRDHCPRHGAFLLQVNLNDIAFKWSPYMEEQLESQGVMGSWGLGSPNTVYLVPYSGSVPHTTVYTIGDERAIMTGGHLLQPDMASTIVHEITHRWQFKTAPVRYLLNRLCTLVWDHIPGLKQLTIEGDVDRNISDNQEVHQFFTLVNQAYDNYIYYQRCSQRREVYEIDPSKNEEDIRLSREQEQYASDQYHRNEPIYQDLAKRLFDIVK